MKDSIVSKIKKLVLIISILGLLIISLFDCSGQPNIVINEFESDPPGNDYDAGNEWVELYNPTTSSIDISNWKIIPTNNETNTIILPEGTIIRSKGYYVAEYSTQFLYNTAEIIILKDSVGNEIDQTPSKNDTVNDERAWARHPNGMDTNDDFDWIFQQSTKGENNDDEDTYGVEPEPSTTETPSPPPPPEETTEPTSTPEQSPSQTPSATSPEPTSPTPSLDESPLSTRSAQTGNYLPYIAILISTLMASIIVLVYIFKILPSRLRALDN
ncbi:lamin tail domain-containing protein [[Eubacterium] cellulosolvens]